MTDFLYDVGYFILVCIVSLMAIGVIDMVIVGVKDKFFS